MFGIRYAVADVITAAEAPVPAGRRRARVAGTPWAFEVAVRPREGPPFPARVAHTFAPGQRVPRAGEEVGVSYRGEAPDSVRLALRGDPVFDPHRTR